MNEDSMMIEIFKKPKTIAVVGMSQHPEKAAHSVPAYLFNQGYNIIPVNPFADKILGIKCKKTLSEIEDNIDIVNIFRPSADALNVIKEAVKRKKERGDIKTIWLQSGINSEEGRRLAEEAGIVYVENMCIYVLHRRYSSQI